MSVVPYIVDAIGVRDTFDIVAFARLVKFLYVCAGFQRICNCHIEGTKWYAVGLADNPRRREKECVNVGIRECVKVVIIHFCVYCENIGAFCEIEVWENGCNFAVGNW